MVNMLVLKNPQVKSALPLAAEKYRISCNGNLLSGNDSSQVCAPGQKDFTKSDMNTC